MTAAFPPFSTVLLAIASDGAYALIVGILLARCWLAARKISSAQPTLPGPRFHPLLLACAAVLAFADAARPWVLAANMSGLTRWRDIAPVIPHVLNTTHQGRIWYFNSGVILALLIAILVSKRGARAAPNYIAIGCLCLLGFAKAATGHAADDGDFTLTAIVQMLHIFATAIWAGSIMISGWLIVPRMAKLTDTRALEEYGNRLSGTAVYAVVVILISGIYIGDRELGNRLSGLWTSPWGEVLAVKLGFVALALLLGACNRFIALKKLKIEGKPEFFVRGAVTEAAVMTIILCLSGLLGGMAPAQSM